MEEINCKKEEGKLLKVMKASRGLSTLKKAHLHYGCASRKNKDAELSKSIFKQKAWELHPKTGK